MNYLQDLFSQSDKRKHALMCAAAVLFGTAMGLVAIHASYALAAWLTGVALAGGYELLQAYRGEGEPSKDDAIAGIIGATVVAGVVAAFEFGAFR